MPQVTFKIEKQAPTISIANGSSENLELFHGIGNTLGFNITGGCDFSMPITIFHVKDGSRAENAGLKLGDSIVTINEQDTSDMTLQEANNVLELAAQKDVKLGVIKFDEVDEANPNKKPAVHNVVLEGSINVESTVKSMQRQLLLIADKVPDDIVLTLLKSFAKILSKEPEPKPKTPFLRAFAKISEDNSIQKPFKPIKEENEDQLKDYESGSSGEDNECSFNYKVTTNTEEIAYSDEGSDQIKDQPLTNGNDTEASQSETESPEISENVDEGIELEMPKLLENGQSAEDSAEQVIDQEVSNADEEFENLSEQESFENVEMENGDSENPIEEPVVEPVEEEIPDYEPIPTEPPKVSLDDIEREIREMQNFLVYKGVKPEKEKKKKKKHEELNENIDLPIIDIKDIEDAYKVDVCIKLKNHKKHHHSKYIKSENYREEIINDGPIFDPLVPNTPEDFMKVKAERIHKKKQKVQALDMSWQNLCESQKKLYKQSQFEKTNKNVEEQQKLIKFN